MNKEHYKKLILSLRQNLSGSAAKFDTLSKNSDDNMKHNLIDFRLIPTIYHQCIFMNKKILFS